MHYIDIVALTCEINTVARNSRSETGKLAECSRGGNLEGMIVATQIESSMQPTVKQTTKQGQVRTDGNRTHQYQIIHLLHPQF